MSLYEQFNSPITAGSPGYEQRTMQDTQENLQPQYQQASNQLNQNLANRGISNSGVAAQGQMNLSNDYLKQMGSTAAQAAMQSANLAEQNRQREELLNFQNQMLDKQLAQQQGQFNTQANMANTGMWASLLSPMDSQGGAALYNYFSGSGGANGDSMGAQNQSGLNSIASGIEGLGSLASLAL